MDRSQPQQNQRSSMNFNRFCKAGENLIHLIDSNSSQRKSFNENGMDIKRSQSHHKSTSLPVNSNRNCNYNNQNNTKMFTNQNHKKYYHSQPKNKEGSSNQNNENNTNSSDSGSCFINGIKTICKQFVRPKLRCDFYLDHNRSYNPKYRNNITNSNQNRNNKKMKNGNQSETNPNSKNNLSNKCNNTGNKMDNNVNNGITSEIVAIFTSADFPELPTPKKRVTDNVHLQTSCMATSNTNLHNKNTKKNKYNKKTSSDSDSSSDFVMLSSILTQPNCNKDIKSRAKTRQRQISECSDDSFIICFDSNAAEGLTEYSDDTTDQSYSSDNESHTDDEIKTDDETDIDYESDIDEKNASTSVQIKNNNSKIINNKTEIYDSLSEGTSQPDSGFDDGADGGVDGGDVADNGKKKKVRFDLKVEIHVMHTWNFAYRAARKGHWETYSRDSFRFKRRVERLSTIINPILDIKHRDEIFKTRFCDN